MKVGTMHTETEGAWPWLVLMASYSTLIIVGTSIYMSGVLYVAFLDTFNEGPAKTAAIGSLNTGLLALLGPLSSSLINASSCRVSMFLGGLMCSVCYLVGFFLYTVDGFIVVLGVFGGLANSLMCIPAVVILAYYFQERRNLFISLSTVVVGLGMFIASPLGLFLLETYGLRGTMLILSGLNANCCVFGMVCRPSSTELSIKEHQAKNKKHANYRRKPESLVKRTRLVITTCASILNADLLTHVPFLLFLLSTMSWSLMLTICLQHLPNYVVGKGATDADISTVMSVFSLSHTLGRSLTALVVSSNGLDFMTLHVGMSGIIGITSLAFPFYGHLSGSEYWYAAVVGLYTGGMNTLLTPITLNLVEVKRISSAHGMSFCFSGMGLLLGPYLAGVLYGITGSYDSTFVIGGAVVMAGCLFGLGAAIQSPNTDPLNKQTDHVTIEVPSGRRNSVILVQACSDKLLQEENVQI